MNTAAVNSSGYNALYQQLTAENSAPEWLKSMRASGIDGFQRLGFPTTRDEQWRFTDVGPIATGRFSLATEAVHASADSILAGAGFGLSGPLLVFVDGHFQPGRSRLDGLPGGITVSGKFNRGSDAITHHLGQYADPGQNAFAALNTAFIRDGAVIEVAADIELLEPIHILYLQSGKQGAVVTFPRNLIAIGANSSATIIESYIGQERESCFTNAVTEIVVEANGSLNHTTIQRENSDAYHLKATHVRQEQNSRYTSNVVTLGGAISRNDINVYLDGEGCECTLNGLYIGADCQLIDNHTRIDHAKPNCNSWEVYKGILDDKACGVFNGKIHVHPDAQKTDAKQTNRVLLLSDDAKINTKPELEIYADDVKCTHGATVGQMESEALFYLRSRGIPFEVARSILIFAFASDVLEGIGVDAVRDEINDILTAAFRK